MHPRNIFKNGVNFEVLRDKYDFLKSYVVEEKPSKFTVDFDNREAVAALNKALLIEYFKLDVDIPPNFLIPRIPLRVNYVLWIEDLLNECLNVSSSEDSPGITGLDIGTGPCAIYAILCARMNNWSMHGTDINENSVKLARSNIKKNKLEESVKGNCSSGMHSVVLFLVHHISPTTFFKEVSEISSCTFHFSMCNPPFFSDTKDPQLRHDLSKTAWETKSEIPQEIVCEGGEVNFVWKMIEESKKFHAVRIFTTMIGVKKHLTTITKRMKEIGLSNFITCIFHQGRTSRWGLAWAWDKSIKFDRDTSKSKKPCVFSAKIEKIISFQGFMQQLEKVLSDLQMKVKKLSTDTLCVDAETNTWSHSRRKRRMELRATTTSHPESVDKNDDSKSTSAKLPRLQNEESTQPVIDADTGLQRPVEHTSEPSTTSSNIPATKELCLSFKVIACRDNNDIILNMHYLQGTLGKDAAHQVLQYLKNSKFT